MTPGEAIAELEKIHREFEVTQGAVAAMGPDSRWVSRTTRVDLVEFDRRLTAIALAIDALKRQP